MDSNHRSEDATDLQSAPIGHSGTLPYSINGAGGRIRTPDLLITNQLLYQLSYTSVESACQLHILYMRPKEESWRLNIISIPPAFVKPLFYRTEKTFTGARYAPFLLLFLPRGSKIKEEEKRRADAARHTTEQRK